MEKRSKILVGVTTGLILTIGITFAYFMARTGAGAQSNVNITSDTVDDLKFSVDKDINLSANQFNFAQGNGNLSDSVTATASLKANSTKKSATYKYNVYFLIEDNDYIYTNVNKMPEIMLNVTGPNGEITSIVGLEYTTSFDSENKRIEGFDITTINSKILKIASDYEISSDSSTNYTNQEWKVKVTFVNLSSNQTDNEGKKLTAKVIIQKESIPFTLEEVAKSGNNLAEVIKTLGDKSIPAVSGIYHHDNTLANSAEDDSYRYAGSNPNNYICIGSQNERCNLYSLYRIIGVFDGKVKVIKSEPAQTIMLGGYDTDGTTKIGDFEGTYTAPTDDYTGEYHYTDFQMVGRYYWNSADTTAWRTSKLNTINLNNKFIEFLDILNKDNVTWKNKIANTTWQVGGVDETYALRSNAKTTYDYEIGANKYSNTVTSKIGLIYLSDFYYASLPKYWTLPGYSGGEENYRKAKNYNWLNKGLCEWTLTPRDQGENGNTVFLFCYDGTGRWGWVYHETEGNPLRPSFYLTADTTYVEGDGSRYNPYKIVEVNRGDFAFKISSMHLPQEYTFYAKKDMTWKEFLNSDFNDGNFGIKTRGNLKTITYQGCELTDTGTIPITEKILKTTYGANGVD